MSKIIKRDEVHTSYKELLELEAHHDHEIIMDDHGTIRWKKDPEVDKLLEKISLNDLCPLLHCLGYGYRDLPWFGPELHKFISQHLTQEPAHA